MKLILSVYSGHLARTSTEEEVEAALAPHSELVCNFFGGFCSFSVAETPPYPSRQARAQPGSRQCRRKLQKIPPTPFLGRMLACRIVLQGEVKSRLPLVVEGSWFEASTPSLQFRVFIGCGCIGRGCWLLLPARILLVRAPFLSVVYLISEQVGVALCLAPSRVSAN